MSRWLRMAAGSVVTLAVVAVVALFSAWPRWQTLAPGTGVVSLSFSHGGARACRPLAEAERARLPANMRRQEVCDRERAALRLEFVIDGTAVLRETLAPSGLAGDGPARVYERFRLPAGPHEIVVRLADSGRAEGFDHQASRRVTLAPAENLVIDFRPGKGGFVFR